MVKIRLAIIDNDEAYTARISCYFSAHYRDSLSVSIFTGASSFLNRTAASKFDVVLANSEMKEIAASGDYAFAYLTENSGLTSIGEIKAIGKFQRAESFYKELLNVYLDFSENQGLNFAHLSKESSSVITFFSAGGGTGVTTMAAAFCYGLSSEGKKVLYLNLEHFGEYGNYFSGDGSYDMSDIVFAVKNRKINLALKLQSTVRIDNSQTRFFEACKTPLDVRDLTTDDIVLLLKELRSSDSYDFIVLDVNMGLDEKSMKILTLSDSLIAVSSGTDVCAHKLKSFYEICKLLEPQLDVSLVSRMAIVYNHAAELRYVTTDEFPSLGKVVHFQTGTPKEIAQEIARSSLFSKF